jgi:frataxin
MDDREFEILASSTLARLAERLEDALDDADVEFREGILTVELADGRQYVLNKHAPSRELWLSSPASGAHHFAAAGGAWRSTRGAETLAGLLATELGVALD